MVNMEAVDDMLDSYKAVSNNVDLLTKTLSKCPNGKNSFLEAQLKISMAEYNFISDMLVAEYEQINLAELAKELNIN
jgi:hypothetical protein